MGLLVQLHLASRLDLLDPVRLSALAVLLVPAVLLDQCRQSNLLGQSRLAVPWDLWGRQHQSDRLRLAIQLGLWDQQCLGDLWGRLNLLDLLDLLDQLGLSHQSNQSDQSDQLRLADLLDLLHLEGLLVQ